MGRRDNFSAGHGKDDDDNEKFEIHLSPEDVEFYKRLANLSRNHAAMQEHMRTQPTDLSDHVSLQQHLMTAHGLEHYETTHYDWQAHSEIPSIHNRYINSADDVQELDTNDLRALHSHDHNKYSEDYPHTTLGSSHFHH